MNRLVAVNTEFGSLKTWASAEHELDGTEEWQLRCPGCGQWGYLDDDQFHGRVSVDCESCSYHETHDFASAVRLDG